jgi:hypothetical protein
MSPLTYMVREARPASCAALEPARLGSAVRIALRHVAQGDADDDLRLWL